MNDQPNNIIDQEKIINTRKELWDSLFLFVNFQGLKSEFPNMWNKDYNLIPLPNSYKETREKLTKYCKELNGKLEKLINSFNPYFQSEIYPVLKEPHGDKTLAFRCDRLLKNKMIGESASLFLDLVIWEIEYRQVEKFKDKLDKLLNIPIFLTDEEKGAFANDCEKLIEGKINHSLGQRFFFKWNNLMMKKSGQEHKWKELGEYLKDWEKGIAGTYKISRGRKIGSLESQWKKQLTIFQEQIEAFFLLGSETISDGKPFFQLGFIKSDTETGLIVSTQNRKGFSLNNPSLAVINFHQKYFRVYRMENYQHINPRNLYIELFLKEDWVWKEYPSVVHNLGSLNSNNHPIYHGRNLT